jgi:hypothetical protein
LGQTLAVKKLASVSTDDDGFASGAKLDRILNSSDSA